MSFWRNKRVLVTGHTGFKGAWLCELLLRRGAIVSGLALPPEDDDSLFSRLQLTARMQGGFLDVRDAAAVAAAVDTARPEIVLHLAAQSLVRRSYRDPVGTWATNVMGTAHLLEALRNLSTPVTAIIVTTDKVYENHEWPHAYRENDALGGHDPSSASKAATELVSASWRRSFGENHLKIAPARAGNVIGGGDGAEDRLVPDIIRALMSDRQIEIRNPRSIRPWQHVLDPLHGYLMLAEKLHGSTDGQFETAYNFGPELSDVRSVETLVKTILATWPGEWIDASDPGAAHEAGRLSLTIEKAKNELDWKPVWPFERAVEMTVDWYRKVAAGSDAAELCQNQIADFETGT